MKTERLGPAERRFSVYTRSLGRGEDGIMCVRVCVCAEGGANVSHPAD